MNTGADVERIAVLLHALGPDATDSILSQLSGEQSKAMKSMLVEINKMPPTIDQVDAVLDEFQRVLRFAVTSEGSVATNSQAASSTAGEKNRRVAERAEFESSGDPLQDLERLEDFQIAGALRGESTASIVVLLGCLPPKRAGEIIQQLPEESRSSVFIGLSNPPQVPPELVTRIAQTIVLKGGNLDETAVSDPQQLADEKLAEVLRSMDRGNRQSMIVALEKADNGRAERIKGMLYMFEDLLRVTDRSIQKLLAEVDSSSLSTALKNAPEDIVQKITSNLSKRARATLMEEIEYLGTVTAADQERAEKQVCDAMSRLDQAGNLEMME